MPIPTSSFPRAFARVPALVGALLFIIAVVGCGDHAGPMAVVAPPRPVPALLDAIRCHGAVMTRELSCGEGTLPSSARGYIIVGAQHVFVNVTTDKVVYNPDTGKFTFSLTLQNLVAQPMGTIDGVTPDPAGVRVLFAAGPAVWAGSGVVDVVPDGFGTFTSTGQAYYEYSGLALGADGILSHNETAQGKTWTLNIPPTVQEFGFLLYVAAEVPYPNGYIDVAVSGTLGGGSTGVGTPGGGAPSADTVLVRATGRLTATVRSAAGTALPGEAVTWVSSDPTVATIDASGAFTAVAPGSATLSAVGGGRAGSLLLQVCPDLDVGGVYISTVSKVCVGTGGAAAEYVVTATNLAGGAAPFTITGTGIVPATGPPNPLRSPAWSAGMHFDLEEDDFHPRLLDEGLGMARAAPGLRPRHAIIPGVPEVGAVMNLDVSGTCNTPEVHTATVKAVGRSLIVMEDNTNPAGGLGAADYQQIVTAFDDLIRPTVTRSFGSPGDLDDNNRVIVLFTRAVNALTPAGVTTVKTGFFNPNDLSATSACPASNFGEILYLLAPDPGGTINGHMRSAEDVREAAFGTLAHELQHLVNASRRRFASGGPYPPERPWLDEGLSHVAEELVYYASTGHHPGENIGITVIDDLAHPDQTAEFERYADANFARLRKWLLDPGAAGPFKDEGKELSSAVRGAVWSFLRYAADRKGGDQDALWNDLVLSRETGLANLAHALGTDPLPWFRDWTAATYLDDAVTGVGSIYTQPSWNFRAIFDGTGNLFPLPVRQPTSGGAEAFTISGGGGAAYVRVGVPSGAFGGLVFSAPSETLPVVVMRTR